MSPNPTLAPKTAYHQVLILIIIQLFTHASLMFASECLGELKYEGTTAAILMAGVFLSFLVEYLGHRFLQWRSARKQSEGDSGTSEPRPADTEVLTVIVLESGIIFHSLRKPFPSIHPPFLFYTILTQTEQSSASPLSSPATPSSSPSSSSSSSTSSSRASR